MYILNINPLFDKKNCLLFFGLSVNSTGSLSLTFYFFISPSPPSQPYIARCYYTHITLIDGFKRLSAWTKYICLPFTVYQGSCHRDRMSILIITIQKCIKKLQVRSLKGEIINKMDYKASDLLEAICNICP